MLHIHCFVGKFETSLGTRVFFLIEMPIILLVEKTKRDISGMVTVQTPLCTFLKVYFVVQFKVLVVIASNMKKRLLMTEMSVTK
jgi:hypothetical protein